MHYIFYLTRNLINGKIYVGVHKENGRKYLGSGRAIQNAVRKYGRENFVRETHRICDNPWEAYRLEALIVSEAFIARKDTYNLKTGGSANLQDSEETKKRKSESMSNKPKEKEHRAKISSALKGLERTEEHCENISRAKTGQKIKDTSKMTESKKGKSRGSYREMSPEVKERLKLMRQSIEFRNKISQTKRKSKRPI